MTKTGGLSGKVLWSRFSLFCWASKTRKFSGSRKPVYLFCKWQCRQWTVRTENSLSTIFITLWRIFPCLKVRWSSEHSFIPAFESLCRFRQLNHPVSLYFAALWDALHIEIEQNLCSNFVCKHLEFCAGPCRSERNKGSPKKIDLRALHIRCTANMGRLVAQLKFANSVYYLVIFQKFRNWSCTLGIAEKQRESFNCKFLAVKFALQPSAGS